MRERDRKRGTLPSPDMTATVHYRNKQTATVSLIVAFFLVPRAAANFLLTSCHAVQHSAPLLVETVVSDDSSLYKPTGRTILLFLELPFLSF